ncbi:uncharacterized protein TNCV_3861081 [Trichonephila clavipes]|nr:uncharacterized protein TNCV_3861081 [Trichonephila clavipes]
MLQLSPRTVTRRIELLASNLEVKLANDVETCEFFSIQLDESADAVDTAQLAISVKMVFDDFSKKEFLKILPLTARTQGKDIFSLFKKFAKLPLQKSPSITTDGARAMTESISLKIVHKHSQITIHLKALVFEMLVLAVKDIMARIVFPSADIVKTPDWFEHIRQSFVRRCRLCYDLRGLNFEHFLEKETPNSTTLSKKIAQGNLTASCKRLISWFLLYKGTELGRKIVPVRPPKF